MYGIQVFVLGVNGGMVWDFYSENHLEFIGEMIWQ
jgi:hypothetical protein